MRTLLFDIDGTLLLTNRGGQGALELALQQEFDLPTATADVDYAGRTDRGILDELLILNGLQPTESNRERLQNRYISLLPQMLQQRGGTVLPGVVELLERLATDARVCVSVMTGNLVETAHHKLDHFGLRHYVRWIVGGDSDLHRDDLARRAREVIRSEAGEQACERIMVIGDTPADIRCGHAIGAAVVAVCTGGYSREMLEIEKPLLVVDDLSDLVKLLPILVGETVG
ncbi:HAD family hydrolase [Novipirellula rosea]|uniref:phosphoglycolate phosphatase n=1 Tax=Novipirellula rosea TaxID=1031540 RepID=A0ABP8NP02_9BACT|tara:strand:- start:3510 stop:4196 length:687 start_codon:yes stop_codon:yes gene_type:complete